MTGPQEARADSGATGAESSDDWNLFNRAEEARLGAELDEWMRGRVELLDDHALDLYLHRLASRLERRTVTTGIPPVPVEVLPERQAHALVFPGGSVYLTSGMVAKARDEQQLAALLAHQIAHLRLRHGTQAISREKRFLVPAVLATASTGEVSLLEALEQAGISPLPGAPWMQFNESAEDEAIVFSAELLQRAGFDPAAASSLPVELHGGRPSMYHEFLQEHPLPQPPPDPAQVPGQWQPLLTERDFRELQSRAAHSKGQPNGLEAVYVWEPPKPPAQPPESRELFITRSYQFSYPADWTVERPGEPEAIVVAPKGQREPSGIRAGVMAGTIVWDANHQDPEELLLGKVQQIRPGLEPAPDADTLPETGVTLDGQVMAGNSGPGGQPEIAWVFTRGLSERVFYMLMLAPEDEFDAYRDEFERIFHSIAFEGPPASGQAGDP